MYSKLVVLFALAVLGNCAPLNTDVFKELVGSSQFNDFYQQHVKNKQLGTTDESFGNFLVETVAKFKNWQSKIQDQTSQEYLNLVTAQNGNPVIPVEQKILLSHFLESLFHNAAVNVGLSNENIANQASHNEQSNTINQSTSSTSTSSVSQNSQSSVSSNYESQSAAAGSSVIAQNNPVPQNLQFSNSDIQEFEQLDNKYLNQASQSNQATSTKQNSFITHEASSNFNQNQQSSSSSQHQSSSTNAQNEGFINKYNSMNNVNNIQSENKQNNYNKMEQIENSSTFNQLENSLKQYSNSASNQQIVSKVETQEEKEEARKEAHNAHYTFASTVDDNIQGNYQQHLEVRKDGKVYGKYSYDDGNNFITRYYVADENGFRIVKEIVAESTKSGHQLNGQASVQISRNGLNTGYQITANDINNCHHNDAEITRPVLH